MKSLLKIIRRYSFTAGMIIFVILISNFAVLVYWGWRVSNHEEYTYLTREAMEQVGTEIIKEEGQYSLSEQGINILEESGFLWGMALDADGKVVWEWQLPADFLRAYSIQDVASFTKWYLEDYPVRVWSYNDLLLVFGNDPAVEVKYSLVMGRNLIEGLPMYIRMFLAANLLVILLFVLCYGYRFYRSLKPVAEGIEKLSRQEKVYLKEKGLTGELAAKLNQTSRLLESKNAKLNQRDEARTEWISGVSHDIRTPLALIVGYSDRLAEEAELGEEEKSMVLAIRRQSMVISQLIQDLNLTSKLEYQAQPLHKSECFPARLVRECAADIYNDGIDSDYEIEVSIPEEAEQVTVQADEGLIRRALRNLLGNSIRHNPQGCRISVTLCVRAEKIGFLIRDTGAGIPERVVWNMNRQSSTVHIMGLRLTSQIARSHGGELIFRRRKTGTYDAELWIGRE